MYSFGQENSTDLTQYRNELTTYSLLYVLALYKCLHKGEHRRIEKRETFHGVEMVAPSNEPAERTGDSTWL
jgi:hypothetical protein